MIGKGWLNFVVIAAWGLFAGGLAAAGASGFSATDPGVKAMGLAGAVVARADDPTADFYNPGALALVKKGKLTVGVGGAFQNESHYQGLPPGIGAGTAAQQDRFFQVPASAFAALPLGAKVKLGIGVYTPFALRTDWADPDNFAGRFLSTRSLPTADDSLADISLPWQRHLTALYTASTLIMLRSVFRIVEYVQGNDGYLLGHEWVLYVLDAVVMLVLMVALSVVHPRKVKAVLGGGGRLVRGVVGSVEK